MGRRQVRVADRLIRAAKDTLLAALARLHMFNVRMAVSENN